MIAFDGSDMTNSSSQESQVRRLPSNAARSSLSVHMYDPPSGDGTFSPQKGQTTSTAAA